METGNGNAAEEWTPMFGPILNLMDDFFPHFLFEYPASVLYFIFGLTQFHVDFPSLGLGKLKFKAVWGDGLKGIRERGQPKKSCTLSLFLKKEMLECWNIRGSLGIGQICVLNWERRGSSNNTAKYSSRVLPGRFCTFRMRSGMGGVEIYPLSLPLSLGSPAVSLYDEGSRHCTAKIETNVCCWCSSFQIKPGSWPSWWCDCSPLR